MTEGRNDAVLSEENGFCPAFSEWRSESLSGTCPTPYSQLSPMKDPFPKIRPLMVASSLLAALSLQAQSPGDDSEVIELSPFRVQTAQDSGYLATNSISGTRLNMEIQSVPLNLEAITNEQIQHTGSLDLRESLRYSAGIVLESQSDAFVEVDGDPQGAGANDPRGVTRRAGDSAMKLRGFASDQTLREGFRRNYTVDSINIERVEVLRGPSALLYGIGNFGGVTNFVTKKPIFEEFSSYIGMAVGSDDLLRGEFDFTGPMVSKDSEYAGWRPAFRVTGVAQTRGDHTQYYEDDYYMISPSFSIQPFEHTRILFENEFGYREEEGVGFQNIRNNVAENNPAPGRNASWLTDIFDEETSDVIGHRVDNRTFRWSGPDTYLKGPYSNHVLDLEQGIGENAMVKIGVSRTYTTFDSRQINAGVARGVFPENLSHRANELYGTVFSAPMSRQAANGAPNVTENSVISYEWIDVNRDEVRDQVRAEGVYRLETDNWGRHTVIAGVQYMGVRSEADQYGPGYSYGDASTFVPLWERYSYKHPEDYTPFVYGVQGDGEADNPRQHLYYDERRTWDLGYYAVYQGEFFDDRLTLIGGLRWDRSDARESRDFIWESNRASELHETEGGAPTGSSPQLGLSYRITEGLNIFGVYSTGLVPNYYDRDGYGNIVPSTEAENYEVGIKFNLFDGKVAGTISAYQIERKNQPKFVWWAPSPYQSELKGYDPSLPNTTVLWYATPDAFWHGIHDSELSAGEATALAKQMWSPYWHDMIDEIAASPEKQVDWAAYGPQAASFWDWAWESEANTNDPNYTGDVFFPLVNYSDPDVAAFMTAVHLAPGWKGNYYYTQGQQYSYGNGEQGYGNAPDGSGASVLMDDEAKGWDAHLTFTPIPEFQILVRYSHIKREVTTRSYRFARAPYWPGGSWFASDNNYGTLDSTKVATEVYDDVEDTSSYNQTVPEYGRAADDTPENQVTVWARYNLSHMSEALSKWTIGGGMIWEDKRPWFTGFTSGGGNIELIEGTRELVELWTDDRWRFDAFVEYKTRINDDYDLRLQLNVNNVLDDRDQYGYVYAPGRSVRFFMGLDF